MNISPGPPATLRSSSMRRFMEGTSGMPGIRSSKTMPSRVRDLKRKTLVLVPSSDEKLNVLFVDENQDVNQQRLVCNDYDTQ